MAWQGTCITTTLEPIAWCPDLGGSLACPPTEQNSATGELCLFGTARSHHRCGSPLRARRARSVTLNRAHPGHDTGRCRRPLSATSVVSLRSRGADMRKGEHRRRDAAHRLSRHVHGRRAGRAADGKQARPSTFLAARSRQRGAIMFSSGTTGRSKGVVIPHGMFDAGRNGCKEAWAVTGNGCVPLLGAVVSYRRATRRVRSRAAQRRQ